MAYQLAHEVVLVLFGVRLTSGLGIGLVYLHYYTSDILFWFRMCLLNGCPHSGYG